MTTKVILGIHLGSIPITAGADEARRQMALAVHTDRFEVQADHDEVIIWPTDALAEHVFEARDVNAALTQPTSSECGRRSRPWCRWSPIRRQPRATVPHHFVAREP